MFDKKTVFQSVRYTGVYIYICCLWYVFFFFPSQKKKNITNIGLRYCVVEMFILYFQFTTCYGQYLHFKYKRSRKIIMSDNKYSELRRKVYIYKFQSFDNDKNSQWNFSVFYTKQKKNYFFLLTLPIGFWDIISFDDRYTGRMV